MKNASLLKSAVVALSTFALAVPLTACGGGAEAGATSCKGSKVTAGIVNSLSDSILLIADAKGYFKDEGLEVTLSKFDSAAKMIPLLGSGQLDVGAGAPSAGFYNAVSRDINLKIVADKGELVDSGEVKTVADLKGLTVAEPAEGTTTAATLDAVLTSGGLTYDDIQHEFLGFPDQFAAFENGSIDAATTTEPTATTIVDSGAAVRFADSTEEYNEQQLAVVLYSSNFAEKKSAAAQCFMNAYVRATHDYSAAVEGGQWDGEGADEVLKIVSNQIGLPIGQIKKTVPSFVSPNAEVNLDSLTKDYDFFQAQGWTEGDPLDVSTLVDNSFVQKAQSESEGQ
jgi:NitT/TauT family transport system substrate-binding protein